MTTATAVMNNGTMVVGGRPRPSLEELVDRVMEAIFASSRETPPTQTVARRVHDARRLRQAGNPDGALALMADLDTATADTRETRWAFAEWQDLVRRRFGQSETLMYSQDVERVAALVPQATGTVQVVAVLGMRWQTGKLLSSRSVRGLRPLAGGSWS